MAIWANKFVIALPYLYEMPQIGSFSLFLSNWLRNSSAVSAVFVAFSTSLNPKEPSAFRAPLTSPFCVPLTVSYGVRKRLFAKILLPRWRRKHFLCQLDSSPPHSQENDLLLFCCIPNSTINGNQQSYYIQGLPEEICHWSGERYFGSVLILTNPCTFQYLLTTH